MLAMPRKHKIAQKTKGRLGAIFAVVLPKGGEKRLPIPMKTIINPVAIPAWAISSSLVSMVIVNKIAIIASRAKPAAKMPSHNIPPLNIENIPIPTVMVEAKTRMIFFLSPNLSAINVIGMMHTILAKWNDAASISALISPQPKLRKYSGK